MQTSSTENGMFVGVSKWRNFVEILYVAGGNSSDDDDGGAAIVVMPSTFKAMRWP